MGYNILKYYPYLKWYKDDIELRVKRFESKKAELLNGQDITCFADGYKYFGIHRTKKGWVYREWAPAAEEMYFTGDFNNWDTRALKMEKLENGVFEVEINGKNTLKSGQKVQAIVIHNGEEL